MKKVESKATGENPDRLNVSFGMKLPGPIEYSSVTFNVSYTSDVKAGETLEEAWDRVKQVVDERANEYYDQYGQLQSEEDEEYEEED